MVLREFIVCHSVLSIYFVSVFIMFVCSPSDLYIQSVREAKFDSARGGRGRGRGYARGAGPGPNRDFANNENSYGNKEVFAAQGAPDEVDGRSSERRGGGYGGPRGAFRGGRRGGFSNGDAGEGDRRRPLERRSGTGRGYVCALVILPVLLSLSVKNLMLVPSLTPFLMQD